MNAHTPNITRIPVGSPRIAPVATAADIAVRNLIAPLSQWLPNRREWFDCPDCLEHGDGRECHQCDNRGWLWAEHSEAEHEAARAYELRTGREFGL